MLQKHTIGNFQSADGFCTPFVYKIRNVSAAEFRFYALLYTNTGHKIITCPCNILSFMSITTKYTWNKFYLRKQILWICSGLCRIQREQQVHFRGRNLLLGCFKGGGGHTLVIGKGAVELEGATVTVTVAECWARPLLQAPAARLRAAPRQGWPLVPCPWNDVAGTKPRHPGLCVTRFPSPGLILTSTHGLPSHPSLNPCPGRYPMPGLPRCPQLPCSWMAWWVPGWCHPRELPVFAAPTPV